METQTTLVVEKITNNLAFRIGQLFVFIAFFYTSSINAQSTVANYPATDMGQSLLINSNSPYWGDMQSAAAEVRLETQEYINNCATCEPPLTNYRSCVKNVCCETSGVWVSICGCYRLVTVCWETHTMTTLCTIVQ